MTETAGDGNLGGIFNRAARGYSPPPVAVPVERGAVCFFAQVVGEIDPIHTDLAAARALGYPDLVAPPSFFMAIEAAASHQTALAGIASIATAARYDFRYLLHGDEAYTYDGIFFAGEEVNFVSKIVDFYDKKGGTLEFIRIESFIEHATRGTLVRGTRNLLHRLPKPVREPQ